MEQDLICFVILSNDEAAYNNCIHCLDQLVIPIGMRVQYMRGNGYDGSKTAVLSQTAMMSSKAKYKIYMTDRVSITNPRFLPTVIDAFRSDETLGILGVMGYSVPPFSDDFWTSAPIGAVTFCKDGKEKNAHYIYDEKNITPAKVLIPPILATQHDVPWRQMFQGARYAAMSLSLEHQRKGYKAAVLPQEAIWCSAEEISCDTPDDEMCYRLEYAPEISGEFFVEPPGRNYHPQIDPQFDGMRFTIARFIRRGDISNATKVIIKVGLQFLQYNQFLRDETIESALRVLCNTMNEMYPDDLAPYTPDENCILFYDGICYDTRGLACIYLKALADLGYKILYITPAYAKGTTPTIMKILENAPTKPEIVYIDYIDQQSPSDYIHEVCQTVQKHRPAQGFLYIDSINAVGVLAFMRLKGLLTRYFLDLGDHTYYMGTEAFDVSLDRNWGASVGHWYRRIPQEKFMRHFMYPFFDKDIPFQGYPFERKSGDFVVFSGGMVYKTVDDEMTYYKIVAWILQEFPQVKFWYASKDDGSGLHWLMETFPGRVFHTAERSDLFQIMENIDMYLSTYPFWGNLMMQYSAMAGKAPLSLRTTSGASEEILFNQDSLGIIADTVVAFQTLIHRYISDPKYRDDLNAVVKENVPSPELFRKNLEHILKTNSSAYELDIHPVDLTGMQKWFFGLAVQKWLGGAAH